MNLNWFAAEMLMKQHQREIERSAREAWKWSEAMPKQSARFFNRRPIIRATPTTCCAASC
ncbi:hypothetical protein [Paenibacillus sp. VTT E-133280]|uniref:hypothetical protein n=1 Tax=Paenibacillus sp. VTT E-133280 TaxID=1986222 RepID=UPI0015C6465E|nr:hypothetical protein [Paenibacillus sp. VTT E-133280]